MQPSSELQMECPTHAAIIRVTDGVSNHAAIIRVADGVSTHAAIIRVTEESPLMQPSSE